MTHRLSDSPYSDCRTPEEFEMRRQWINMIIFLTMPPIKAQNHIDKERERICQQRWGE